MRIGISISTFQNVAHDGIARSACHLAEALCQVPFVQQVILLDFGGEGERFAGSFVGEFTITAPGEAPGGLDVVVDLCAAINAGWADLFRAGGGRLVHYPCAQPYAGLVEPTIFGREGCFAGARRWDEVWLRAGDARFVPFMRGLYRCPVREMPYLWSPRALEQPIDDGLSGMEGGFAYRRGTLRDGPLIPGIFETNTSPTGMGIIPYLICEDVERSGLQAIERVYFLNSAQFARHPTFIFMVGNTALYQAGKARLEGHDRVARVMARGVNMVIGHQMNSEHSHACLDALHGLYPLVHNSPLLADFGYYYDGSDIGQGAAQVLNACRNHDTDLDSYAAGCRAAIARFSPASRDNVDRLARALLALTAGAESGAA